MSAMATCLFASASRWRAWPDESRSAVYRSRSKSCGRSGLPYADLLRSGDGERSRRPSRYASRFFGTWCAPRLSAGVGTPDGPQGVRRASAPLSPSRREGADEHRHPWRLPEGADEHRHLWRLPEGAGEHRRPGSAPTRRCRASPPLAPPRRLCRTSEPLAPTVGRASAPLTRTDVRASSRCGWSARGV